MEHDVMVFTFNCSGGSTMFVRICLAVVLFTLAACATPYQQMGLLGGVSAQQIDERTVRISARGNAFTSAAVIQEYALLKAAQETVKDSYRYFAVIQRNDASRAGTIVTPGSSSTYATGSVYGSGNYASGSVTSQTYFRPPSYTHFVKPGEDVYIRMFKEDEITDQQKRGVFDAYSIIKYLGPKYLKGRRKSDDRDHGN